MHMQPAAKKYNYSEGDFPVAEKLCKTTISLPVHEFLNTSQLKYMCDKIKEFYLK